MRDVVAGIIAFGLLLAAASLGTTLTIFRKRRRREREAQESRGRTIVAELPVADRLVLFTEDESSFYYDDDRIAKRAITGARVLINGITIASTRSRRLPIDAPGAVARETPAEIEDRPEGIARDRWDVVVETLAAPITVPCGDIRERVSQELARAVYGALKKTLES